MFKVGLVAGYQGDIVSEGGSELYLRKRCY